MNDKKNIRKSPSSIEAEKAVLGCILINNDSISDILEYLSPNSFYENKHRIIFNSMINLLIACSAKSFPPSYASIDFSN